jgi:hypothetical protein
MLQWLRSLALLRHDAVTVFVGYLGTTQQHLRGIAAIERNRLTSEVLKRLFAPLHLASLTRVLSGDPAGRGTKPMPLRCSVAIRTCGPSAGHRWQSRSVVEGARGRDRTLRLPVIRLRPRTFARPGPSQSSRGRDGQPCVGLKVIGKLAEALEVELPSC